MYNFYIFSLFKSFFDIFSTFFIAKTVDFETSRLLTYLILSPIFSFSFVRFLTFLYFLVY